MARRDDFAGFADDARELFGLDRAQADELLDLLEIDDFALGSDSIYDNMWGLVAADALDEIIDFDALNEDIEAQLGPYELDPSFDGDEWLQHDEEYEISAEYGED